MSTYKFSLSSCKFLVWQMGRICLKLNISMKILFGDDFLGAICNWLSKTERNHFSQSKIHTIIYSNQIKSKQLHVVKLTWSAVICMGVKSGFCFLICRETGISFLISHRTWYDCPHYVLIMGRNLIFITFGGICPLQCNCVHLFPITLLDNDNKIVCI